MGQEFNKQHKKRDWLNKDGISLKYHPETKTELYYFNKIQVLLQETKALKVEVGILKSERDEARDQTKVKIAVEVKLNKEFDKWKKDKKKLMAKICDLRDQVTLLKQYKREDQKIDLFIDPDENEEPRKPIGIDEETE